MTPELRTDNGFLETYHLYVDMVYHICLMYMKNKYDAEDIVQETFVKLLKRGQDFEREEHKKAWLIVTATNLCKDQLKHWWQKRKSLEEYEGSDHRELVDTTLMAVMELPKKYRIVVYLYYYQGYNSTEIAAILKKPSSTIRSNLSKAKSLLKKTLGGVEDGREKNQRHIQSYKANLQR